MRRWITFAALLASSAAVAGPPETPKRPVVDVLHGVELRDDYRWLEGDNSDPSNMGLLTEEVAAWTDRQNAYTRSVLDNLPGRNQLEDRLRELMTVGSVSTPTVRGNRSFFSKREGTEAQSSIYVRDGDGTPRRLLDPVVVDPTGLTTISWYSPSPDGELLAFGMYTSGDENSTAYVLDVDEGTWLADEISGKVRIDEWLPDGSGFFYSHLEDIDDPYSGAFSLHKLGTHQREDVTLFTQYDAADFFYADKNLSEDRLDFLLKTWGPWGSASEDARWLLLGYWTGTDSLDLWVADLDHWKRTGELAPVEVAFGQTGRVGAAAFVGDTLFMQTTMGAPNGRVVAIDLNDPHMSEWTDVVPERDDLVIQSMAMARGTISVTSMRNAASQIELFELDGTALGLLELPGIGRASLAAQDDRTEAYLTFSSFNEPRSIYKVDLATGDRQLWDRPDVPVDPSQVIVKQEWYSSKDGTRVPMFIVHKKGLELDGTNPTLLYGYGGFNISQTPFFSSTLYTWYERGGVFAVANIRGGGEFGSEWHRAGMLESKQNCFDDFIAAGEALIDMGYTNPSKLAVSGGSNGGLLVGAVVTQRPDLFRAAISSVPLLDMLRYQDFLMARYWVPEYGSAENPEQFEYLSAYCPYNNIRDGVEYPAVMYTAGENDTRVHPMHARKMAAAMQAATTADADDKPILLWVEREAGHGGGKPLEMRIRDVADSRMFLMWQLGMLD